MRSTLGNISRSSANMRIILEEHLKFVQHEDAVGEDVSLDDIDMIPDLEEEEVKQVGENIFKSRVSINMNPSLINIPNGFKDDKELLTLRIVVPLNNLLQPIKKTGSLSNRFLTDGKFLLPDGVQLNQKILKSVGNGYSLRCKYVKKGTRKEALYNLEKSKHLFTVGD
ncbi:hypothetical protein Cgig2_000299 [Carnegiea gigantea]|uniref:Uncharacterized protein n=1 Tax=Carnegiea gigantea TaxID=171969 RepID=A0A9Q1K399_9CARY|nr:hypothetical protein Cgig2_000299 [Carnegiea gigantea]